MSQAILGPTVIATITGLLSSTVGAITLQNPQIATETIPAGLIGTSTLAFVFATFHALKAYSSNRDNYFYDYFSENDSLSSILYKVFIGGIITSASALLAATFLSMIDTYKHSPTEIALCIAVGYYTTFAVFSFLLCIIVPIALLAHEVVKCCNESHRRRLEARENLQINRSNPPVHSFIHSMNVNVAPNVPPPASSRRPLTVLTI